ncbi:hypothetical protein LXA43DRAFT_1092843 [Ganoderma leucocontextum]|nr:hypothetical protein LXA43DRAFT_1092843 [Ganoderma leucocontextum]
MPISDTQLHSILAILAMLWIVITLSWFFVPISLVLGVSLLSAISNLTAQRVLEAISNHRGIHPPPFVIRLAGWFDSQVIKIVTLVINCDLNAILSAALCWFGLLRDTESPQSELERDSPSSTVKDEPLVSSPCMPILETLSRRTPDLPVQLDAANEAIASMTFRMAVLAEEKDDALTRANTLENVKESWAVRERALVSTIKSLKSSNKLPSDVTGLRVRLQETETMLAHQINVRTKVEDELTRYREIASSQQDELCALRKETSKRIHEQAIEIATLKGQLLAMQERERQLTPHPKRRKTFRFWRKKQVVKYP